jgi:ABC-type uncharacterized transport system fused permease/ATPase subunit
MDSTYTRKETEQLVRKETVAVRRSKILVFLGIILAGVVGGVTTSIIVKNDEKSDFDFQVSLRDMDAFSLPFHDKLN